MEVIINNCTSAILSRQRRQNYIEDGKHSECATEKEWTTEKLVIEQRVTQQTAIEPWIWVCADDDVALGWIVNGMLCSGTIKYAAATPDTSEPNTIATESTKLLYDGIEANWQRARAH